METLCSPRKGISSMTWPQRNTHTLKSYHRGLGQRSSSRKARCFSSLCDLWTVARAAKWTATGTPTAAKAGSLHTAAWQELTIAVDQSGMCTPHSSLFQRGLISMLLSNSTTAHGGGEQRRESS